MSKGEGGGVSIGFGSRLPVSGEKRSKLTKPMELDTHLTQKAELQRKRTDLEKHIARKLRRKADRKTKNGAKDKNAKAI